MAGTVEPFVGVIIVRSSFLRWRWPTMPFPYHQGFAYNTQDKIQTLEMGLRVKSSNG